MNASARAVAAGPDLAERRPPILVLLGLGTAAVALGALAIGAVPVTLVDLGSDDALARMRREILIHVRAPRVTLAAGVGASLALAGAALQGLFRNPLADPGLIGVSSGAALGAIGTIVLGPVLGIEALGPWLLPISAFAGAALVTLFLYGFAHREGQLSVATLLLAGIAVNALAQVGIGVFTFLSDDAQLRTLSFWTLGSFGSATWPAVLPALALMLGAGIALLRQAPALDLLQLGEFDARRVGVPVRRVKRTLVLCVSAGVGAGVALSGTIGFVGLVIPHLVRLLGGASHGYVLPGSLLLGAMLMMLADGVARTIVVPAELPVGLVTGALGAPCFLWLLRRQRPT